MFLPNRPHPNVSGGEADKWLIYYTGSNEYFYFTYLGGREFICGHYRPKYSVTRYTVDPRTTGIQPIYRRLYIYGTDVFTSFGKDNIEYMHTQPEVGSIVLDMTDEERKFGVSTVFAPNVMGVIERSQVEVPWYYEVDNTGWYLNLELPMNKIVIPSFNLPYVSDAWRAYQFREMEYDRAELARTAQYAKDKFWSDVAKGFGNGAVAGGFAGTHSPKFGAQMGIISMAGATVGAYADRQVEIANAQRQQDNKELLMKNAVDAHYNSGHGFRIMANNDFMINIAMPIDDMENEVKISGYSCTGNLVASLERGFIQGLPEPSDAIKGTIRNLITSELQMGVWII